MPTRICALDEIEDPGAKEFTLDEASYFLVRRGEAVYGYLNRCPHAQRFLNWGPDKFLTRDKNRIMCAGHGAVFAMTTGVCVQGPCEGHALTRIDVRVEGGSVVADSGGGQVPSIKRRALE